MAVNGAVVPGRDHLATLHHHGPDGHLARKGCRPCLRQGLRHEALVYGALCIHHGAVTMPK